MWYCALRPFSTTATQNRPVASAFHPLGGGHVVLAVMLTAVLGSVASADAPFACSPRAESDSQAKNDDDSEQLTPIVEELFLGMVVYPQEQNELQLTWGGFHSQDADRDWRSRFEVEYGITDRLQIALECLTELYSPDESFQGARNVGVELYYNFYSDRRTGRAYGVGFEWGAPVDAPWDESRCHEYEPFFVAYQELDRCAVNFFASLEVEDPLAPGEATETTGDLALGLIGGYEPWTPLLEASVEIAPDDTAVRLAPGLYRHGFYRAVDVAVSLPIGLDGDAPKVGVSLMAVVELEPNGGGPTSASHERFASVRRE
jgi:hypothetical protein